MKQFLLALICFSLTANLSIAQEKDKNLSNTSANNKTNKKGFDKSKLVVGGNLGLQFGSLTAIDLSPTVGYRFTPKYTAGIGITYQYYSDNRYAQSYHTSSYGGRIYNQLNVLPNVFLHGEFEAINYEFYLVDQNYNLLGKQRLWVPALFIGGGYSSNRNGLGMQLFLLYDVIQDKNSPYKAGYFGIPGLMVRGGVAIGL